MNGDGPTTGAATWQDPTWRADALAWAVARLAERGMVLTGEPEQPHVRAWSTALRLPVRGGCVWLKSVGPGSAQEAPLARALGEWSPARVLVPLAVEVDRRLLLLPDGGSTMRAAGRSGSDEAWTALLREYAGLQLELVPKVDVMIGLGVPDLRPARLPERAAALLDDEEAVLLDRPGGLTSAQRATLQAERPRFGEECRQLSDFRLPSTLQHDDLHDANVFVVDGGYRFFDWGDASVGHPFLSLYVVLRVAARALDVLPGHPVLHGLRDAYLEEWTAFGSLSELRAQADLALRVAPLARAMTWLRILRGVHPAERAEWQDAVAHEAAEYLRPGILTPTTAAPP